MQQQRRLLRAVLAGLLALTHSQESTEGAAGDPDCDAVPNSDTCLGFLFQDRTVSDERNWVAVNAGGYHTW
jgi:hypothetical protein